VGQPQTPESRRGCPGLRPTLPWPPPVDRLRRVCQAAAGPGADGKSRARQRPATAARGPVGADVAASQPTVGGAISGGTELLLAVKRALAAPGISDQRWRRPRCLVTGCCGRCTGGTQRWVAQPGQGCGRARVAGGVSAVGGEWVERQGARQAAGPAARNTDRPGQRTRADKTKGVRPWWGPRRQGCQEGSLPVFRSAGILRSLKVHGLPG
jgi:hypothetical protein